MQTERIERRRQREQEKVAVKVPPQVCNRSLDMYLMDAYWWAGRSGRQRPAAPRLFSTSDFSFASGAQRWSAGAPSPNREGWEETRGLWTPLIRLPA